MVERLKRDEGSIAYEVEGDGPLVLCIPGMGELRSSYRYTVPRLVDAGMRVATMDLRGHGDSDATFTTYDDVAAAQDALALVEKLGGPAVIVGNSMGAGAAVWAAAEEPGLVSGIVLIGPFVRNAPMNPLLVWAFRAMMSGPWAPKMWTSYLPKLYPSKKPTDFQQHRQEIAQSMKERDKRKAFVATTRTSHAPAESRLGDVKCSSLVVMGDKDPDFPDPANEAEWIAERLNAKVLIVPGAGHYPQVEFPTVVGGPIAQFCTTAAAA
jgi:pimeloyl-ACP methyl ester carboxylesterase